MQDFVVYFLVALITLLIICIFTICSFGKIVPLNSCHLFFRRSLSIVKLSIYSFVLLFENFLDDCVVRAHIVSDLVNEDE